MQGQVRRSGRSTIVYGEHLEDVSEEWFDPSYWRARDAVIGEISGRGAVLLVQRGDETWVLRHYHRGGMVSRFIEDHYLWLGLERTRAFREWRLLAELHRRGLPVPKPIAARVERRGLSYRSDIVTTYLPNTRSLATMLNEGELGAEHWRRIGALLRRFHEQGVHHPDVTVHNILLDEDGIFLVDFDNCSLKPPGAWQQRGLNRLQRSLRKIALETGTRFDERAWRLLEGAYRGEDAAQ